MLSILLKILSILGILLLWLLGIALLLVLLALFYPISYKLAGKKDTGQTAVSAKASWLFGIFRVSFEYPEPGRVLLKVLFFTLFDSGKEIADKAGAGPGEAEKAVKGPGKAKQGQEQGGQGSAQEECPEMPGKGQASPGGKGQEKGADQESTSSEVAPDQSNAPRQNPESGDGSPGSGPEPGESEDNTDPFLFKKFKKIKYTFRSIYDKIKNIWENISYYIELLQEEETKLLFSHVVFRLGKLLRSIRPRQVRGRVLFGTGSPDTTGYAYGMYGMLWPVLGNSFLVTPDFTRAVLEGDICLSGRITVFTILWNGLGILLDKKLKRFIRKMKAGRTK